VIFRKGKPRGPGSWEKKEEVINLLDSELRHALPSLEFKSKGSVQAKVAIRV